MGTIKWIFMACLTAIFSGCLGRDLPQVQHYELNFHQETLKEVKQNRSLNWEIIVSPKIANKDIAYKRNQNRIDYFANNAWIEPFSIMLNALSQKIAENLGIHFSTQGKTLKINVLDCYFDAIKEKVFVHLLVESKDSSWLINLEEKVAEGGFIKIVEAFEIAINRSLTEAFLSGE